MEIKVLDKGFVRLVDVMGTDASIVQAARVSYGEGTKSVREDEGLINYLMKHDHTSPFEMVEMKFHIKMPIFVARQWVRHRTANINEYSARYSELKDDFYIPSYDNIKGQSKTNKQGSEGEVRLHNKDLFRRELEENCDMGYDRYRKALVNGISRELARIGLPLNIYTEMYWKMDLKNLLHFLGLRLDSHAQFEIREFAKAIKEMVKQHFPMTWKAYKEHKYYAVSFSRSEHTLLKGVINLLGFDKAQFKKPEEVPVKAWEEFLTKIGVDNNG